jgi:hypothetical protein
MPNFHLLQNVSFNVTVLEPWQSIFAAFNLNLIAEYEMSIKSLINFETLISTNGIFLDIHYFLSFTIFFDL